MIGLGIASLTLIDGETVELPKNGLVVIVGPNNAGKSVLLSEINHCLRFGSAPTHSNWLKSIQIERQGGTRELISWFSSLARTIPHGLPDAGKLAIREEGGIQRYLTEGDAVSQWRDASGIGRLSPFMISYHDATSRAGLLGQVGPRDPMITQQHPLYRLWDSRELEERFSELVHRAFRFKISINRYGQQVQLLVGRPGMPDEAPPPSQALLEAYAGLASASTQGDGVKSFIGLLLHSIGAGVFVSMIDEPEAFLHPPQARLIGKYLREETPMSGQVIIATHSSHVLQGILDAANDREVKIVRVDTSPIDNHRTFQTLPPDRVKNLWTDPLLRYSGMLDGLFHKGVVVCESDGDARFYSATLDALTKKEVGHDLIFTHVGGKGRLAKSLRELNTFGLRCAVIGDLDVLNDANRVKELVDSAGGNFADFSNDLKLVHDQMTGRYSSATVRSLKDAVREVLKRVETSSISDPEAQSIKDAVKVKSGWNEAKRSGVRAFEGQAAIAVNRLLTNLQKVGIFLVPVGELERWYVDINAGHGISYVTAVLESGRYEHPTSELTQFVITLMAYLGIQET